MNVVSIQKIRDSSCDLAHEIVNDHNGWFVIAYFFPHCSDVWNDDVFNILQLLWRVCDVPIGCENKPWVAAWCFALVHVYDLEISYQRSTENCCNLMLVVDLCHFDSFGTLFLHAPGIAWNHLDARLILV